MCSPAAGALGLALLLRVAVGVAGVLVVGFAVSSRPRRRVNLRADLTWLSNMHISSTWAPLLAMAQRVSAGLVRQVRCTLVGVSLHTHACCCV